MTLSKKGGGTRFVCNFCSNDISSTVRIHCANPICKDFDLCVECFSKGAEGSNHDARTHSYQVIEPHSIPIFVEDWGADEELLLVEGCEKFGLGSWADIADYVGNYRSKEEVEQHYLDTYIHSSKFPLPERSNPNDTSLSDAIPRDEFQARKKRRIEQRKTERAANASASAAVNKKPASSVPSCHEVAGYMPGRLEFENEHLNEAEEAVQHLQFTPGEGIDPSTGDFDPDTKLKLLVMNIYNDRVSLRTDRKKIILRHNLLEYRKNTAVEKARLPDQREFYAKLKPFARLMSPANFEQFTRDMMKEHDLRQAIKQLQTWRQQGITTLRAGKQYEMELANRLAQQTKKQDQAAAVKSFALPYRISPTTAYPDDDASNTTLLLPKERELCSEHGISPQAYNVVKAEIFVQSSQNDGKLSKKKFKAMVAAPKAEVIYEFACRMGWIVNA
ncbi:hypothetical protein K470DRAFT_254111 [Piedraia hortae CBS 480.64]|uniref:Transcriptional adapter 2 n=1 Tax=Piedraia hortae CBS 480.64 TaxID=1314780 RepID=A0A6A7CBD3_9PEZI|nr:hypothetical protein K470DRAFT_254111 [Piedraia hortae CBS 480.64]